MILEQTKYMYNQYDFINNPKELNSVNNKLFATFTPLENIDVLLNSITGKYSILYGKVFILKVIDNEEYICTYNIEQGNIQDIIDNTILVHRKKETNTLYTVNALNTLIESLNEGKRDNKFPINWFGYKNSILLTQKGEFKQLKTKIFKIIEI